MRAWMRAIPAVAVIACGDTSAPSEIRALKFVAISGGDEHTCGLSDERTTYCWGDNTLGQIGAAPRVCLGRCGNCVLLWPSEHCRRDWPLGWKPADGASPPAV